MIPGSFWQYYTQIVAREGRVPQSPKGDLAIVRSFTSRNEKRIESHIFIALSGLIAIAKIHAHAPPSCLLAPWGLTARSALDSFGRRPDGIECPSDDHDGARDLLNPLHHPRNPSCSS